jgi:ATP-dependent Clp protease ATP-binding subunit ClpC
MYDRLVQIAEEEDRTVASVLGELLFTSLFTYRPNWVPSKHLERFNQRSRKVLDLAREEARSFNHNYVGTEHLLLGLLREGEGVAAQVLAALGVTLEKARTAVEHRIGRGDAPADEEIDYVPRARRVLRLAMEEAPSYVRTEHILLGMVREGGGMAVELLDGFGVLGHIREATLARLGPRAGSPAPAPD